MKKLLCVMLLGVLCGNSVVAKPEDKTISTPKKRAYDPFKKFLDGIVTESTQKTQFYFSGMVKKEILPSETHTYRYEDGIVRTVHCMSNNSLITVTVYPTGVKEEIFYDASGWHLRTIITYVDGSVEIVR